MAEITVGSRATDCPDSTAVKVLASGCIFVNLQGRIMRAAATGLKCSAGGRDVEIETELGPYPAKDCGKTWFFTYEEARDAKKA